MIDSYLIIIISFRFYNTAIMLFKSQGEISLRIFFLMQNYYRVVNTLSSHDFWKIIKDHALSAVFQLTALPLSILFITGSIMITNVVHS